MAQCVECGYQFMQTIYIRPDGSEVTPDPRCERCSAQYEQNERSARRQRELVEADAQQRQAWKLSCGVPGMFSGKTFQAFDGKRQPQAFKAAHEWSGGSFVLASPGTFGVGKTHLAAALAGHLIETSQAAISLHGSIVRLPRPVIFTTEQRLLGRIRATFNSDAAENDEMVYLELERVRLLILDDVGKVRPRDPSFLQSAWYRIIDARYTAEKPLVLTTNLSLDELGEHIGGASADRLREMCGRSGLITMKGDSYRRQR